jgi:ferredoxin
MRIDVDYELCEANGVCVGMAPDVFELDSQEHLVVLTDDIPAQRRRELTEIVGSCPRSALILADE